MIDDRPERLRQRAGLGMADIDPDAALAIGMAGYTIDDAALYRGMQLLVPGELAFIDERRAHASSLLHLSSMAGAMPPRPRCSKPN